MDKKMKQRVLNKLIDAGFGNEKAVQGFGLQDMKKADIRNDEIGILLELQQAVRSHKVISFLAKEQEKSEEKEPILKKNERGQNYV